jgi:hypothetical protein
MKVTNQVSLEAEQNQSRVPERLAVQNIEG